MNRLRLKVASSRRQQEMKRIDSQPKQAKLSAEAKTHEVAVRSGWALLRSDYRRRLL
jgi:hypothetical protein